jgi:DNA-directed RNA polymerase specialized sigma subunit
MWDEDADLWSVGALAKAVFGLVASTYIMELGSYMDPKSPAGITVARLARHNIDALNAMIEVNTPAQVRVANRLQSRGVARGATISDLLSTVRLGTYYAAVKFHPRPGANGFVGYCLQTIASQVKREMTALRTIQMPESKLLLVAKMHGWRGRNLQTYGTMSLAEQMEAAQIRGITVHEMSVILQEDQETSTLSVEAMAQAAADHGDDIHADIGANILHDRGEGAERIRDTAFADPRLAVLRPAFLRLSPLHQGLLASLYTCSATDGGDVAWLKHIHERSTQVIHAAVGRIRSGIASQSQVAAGLTVRY